MYIRRDWYEDIALENEQNREDATMFKEFLDVRQAHLSLIPLLLKSYSRKTNSGSFVTNTKVLWSNSEKDAISWT